MTKNKRFIVESNGTMDDSEKDSRKDIEPLLDEMDIEDKMMAGFLFYLADKRFKRDENND